MPKSDWTDYEITIGHPGTSDSECIKLPIHGSKQKNLQSIMTNAFQNALNLLEDSKKVNRDSRVILCSLSCELFLKAIILKTQNRKAWGHDIHELYFKLGENEQNNLLDAFLHSKLSCDGKNTDSDINAAIDDFEKFLMVDACLFETIRYKHEYGTIIYNEWFISNFAHNLKALCCDLGLHG